MCVLLPDYGTEAKGRDGAMRGNELKTERKEA
jgi:hypothetical protein